MNTNDIFNEIKKFRENPKNFIENKQFLSSRSEKNDYTNFINSLEKMGELINDDDLNNLAKIEIEKFKNDENYPCFRIGNELSEINFNENIDKDSVSLIAIEGFGNINSLIPKIISNPSDKDKKGRLILTDQTNIHIGSCFDQEFLILILAKKKKINEIFNKEKEKEIQSNPNSSTLSDKINENNIEDINTKKVETKNKSNKDYFFFFSFKKHTINFYQIKGFQNKNGNPFRVEEIDYKYEDYREKDTIFKIYYFKVSIEPEKCHYLKIELLNNENIIILQSEDIFITENCLGYITLYTKKMKLDDNQKNFKKEEILMQNKKLLSQFNEDKNYMKDIIKKFKVENPINISDLIEISKICCEYECFPFFLKISKKII